MPRALCFAPLILVACASNQPVYEVATCAFGTTDTTCSPIVVPETTGESFMLSFTLVNPNAGVPPGCTGTVDLTVGSDAAQWYGEELDATSCQVVGPTMDGSSAIGAGRVIDLYFPQNAFTFRIKLDPI